MLALYRRDVCVVLNDWKVLIFYGPQTFSDKLFTQGSFPSLFSLVACWGCCRVASDSWLTEVYLFSLQSCYINIYRVKDIPLNYTLTLSYSLLFKLVCMSLLLISYILSVISFGFLYVAFSNRVRISNAIQSRCLGNFSISLFTFSLHLSVSLIEVEYATSQNYYRQGLNSQLKNCFNQHYTMCLKLVV